MKGKMIRRYAKTVILLNWCVCVLIFLLFCNAAKATWLVGQSYDWEFAGWYGGGCYPAIVPDPNIKDRVYLLSDVAGLWRSDNKGDEWYFINNGLVNLNIAVLAVAPSDSNVIYLGTKAGVMRSDNAGKTWHYLISTKGKVVFERPDSYRSLAIDSSDYDKVFAGTKFGKVFFSKDGGNTWGYLGGNRYPFKEEVPITALCLTGDGKKIFVASELGLMLYDFQTERWAKAETPRRKILDMVSSGQDGTIYITSEKQIAYTYDYGKTWKLTNPVPKGEIIRIDVHKDSSGSTKLLAGWKKDWQGGTYLSLDNGKTWENIERNLEHDTVNNPTRAWMRDFGRPNSIVFSEFEPQTIYFTDWWGVWRSDDNGKSWNEKIYGAPNTVGSDIYITSEGEIYVATMDNGLLKSIDGGRNYEPIFPKKGYKKNINGHVWRIIVDPKNSKKIIATSSPWDIDTNQVVISLDGSATFNPVNKGLPDKRPRINTMWGRGYPRAIALDTENPEIIYLGIDGNDGGGLYISRDGGWHWEYSSGQPGSKRIYNALAVDPTDSNRLFWGAYGKKGGIYKSIDNGKNWKRVFSKSNFIFDIAISKKGLIYAAGSLRKKPVLYVSNDNGKTWKLIFTSSEQASCEAIYIDPKDEKRIFVGAVKWHEYTPGKIFYSDDKGENWKDITAGLPVSPGPAAMSISIKENMLYVLLYSGSVYKLNLNTL